MQLFHIVFDQKNILDNFTEGWPWVLISSVFPWQQQIICRSTQLSFHVIIMISKLEKPKQFSFRVSLHIRDISFFTRRENCKIGGGGGITTFLLPWRGITFLLVLTKSYKCVCTTLYTLAACINWIWFRFIMTDRQVDWFRVLWPSVLSVECFETQFCGWTHYSLPLVK